MLNIDEKQLNLTYAKASKKFILAEDDSGFIIRGFAIKSRDADLIIPQSIDGKQVHTIGSNAFCDDGYKFYDVFIPGSIRSIEEDAFHGCSINNTLVISEGVVSIGSRAFGETNLTTIKLPDSLESIGSAAFEKNNNLKKFTLPKNVSSIEGGLFGFCFNLKSISVDKENKYFDARGGCNAIIETATDKLVCGCLGTKIPKGVKSLGEFCFFNIPLSSIDIPEGVQSIEGGALSCDSDDEYLRKHAYQLTSIALPSTLTRIGRDAFSDQKKLKKIEIPSGVSVIENGAFSDTGLQTLIIPEGVTTLGDYAFSGCEKLKKVSIPASVTNFGNSLFPYRALIEKGAIFEVKSDSEALRFARKKKLSYVEK